jgi:hypothetical protein
MKCRFPIRYNNTRHEIDFKIAATKITVINNITNSANILSKPLRILITYEE